VLVAGVVVVVVGAGLTHAYSTWTQGFTVWQLSSENGPRLMETKQISSDQNFLQRTKRDLRMKDEMSSSRNDT
jgi:photosystem II stability/assembly factor-like uncharacterized protein